MQDSNDDLCLSPVLSVEQAEELVEWYSKWYSNGPIWLYNLCELSPEVAEVLAKHKGDIYFQRLTELTPEVAEAIARHQGDHLLFNEISTWSDSPIAA